MKRTHSLIGNGTRRILQGFLLLALLPVISSCQPEPPKPAAPDFSALQRQVEEHTRSLYRLHLKLDSAAKLLLEAEAAAQAGQADTAGYHAADAYEYVQDADEAVLQLGQDLQKLFNLDSAASSQ